MEKKTAQALAKLLDKSEATGLQSLGVDAVSTFHQWARNKPTLGVYRSEREGELLYLVLLVWKIRTQPDQYNLVAFRTPTGAPRMELHEVQGDELVWRYRPNKRDGRNKDRKARFEESFGALEVKVRIPDDETQVSTFLEAMHTAAGTREHSDALPIETENDIMAAGWLFQANPKYYDLPAALAALDELHWRLRQHKDRIAEDDTVFIWLSGAKGGLMAISTVMETPGVRLPPEAERPFLADDSFEEEHLYARLHIDEVLGEPISRKVLQSHPELADLNFLKNPRGTNFPLTEGQVQALLELAAGERPPRVVKIAPGRKAAFWDECRDGGFICVGWDDVGDLEAFEDFDAFRTAMEEAYLSHYNGSQGMLTKKAKEVWTLQELEPGDKVIANRGTSEVLAVGTVVEPGYAHRPERETFRNTVAVEWDTSKARTIPPQAYWAMVTVSDVPPELYRAIMQGEAMPSPPPTRPKPEGSGQPEVPAFDRIADTLREAGLFYSDEVLSTYLLGLQAKRFVLLTGISGTGKTQLALSVAKELGKGSREELVASVPEGAIELTTMPYMRRYHRVGLTKAVLAVLDLPDSFVSGGRGELQVAWPGGEGRMTLGRVASGKAVILSLKKELRQWFDEHLSEDDPFWLQIEELDDEGNQRLRFGLPVAEKREVIPDKRYRVVAVRPDWTDNRGLLGYFNPVLEQYVGTEFLRLMLRAQAEVQRARREEREPEPFFVILDEMNLARVEHYFSDFLSCLESGEPLSLHDDDEVASGERSDSGAVPMSLKVPENLYFTGTVNVDETTYMFSPKVLDRAFTLELNQVDLTAYGATRELVDGAGDAALRLSELPELLRTRRAPSSLDWEALGSVEGGELRRVLRDLHSLLADENRHFGYRVANEIARFVVLASEQGADTPSELWAALDLSVLMKVLPKLHGTQQELEDLLTQLFAFAVTTDSEAKPEGALAPDSWEVHEGVLEWRGETDSETARLPRTAAKLWRMLRRLRRQGFTSFIE